MEEKHSWNKVNGWTEELELLHVIIAKTDRQETVKWGAPVFYLEWEKYFGNGRFQKLLAPNARKPNVPGLKKSCQ